MPKIIKGTPDMDLPSYLPDPEDLECNVVVEVDVEYLKGIQHQDIIGSTMEAPDSTDVYVVAYTYGSEDGATVFLYLKHAGDSDDENLDSPKPPKYLH